VLIKSEITLRLKCFALGKGLLFELMQWEPTPMLIWEISRSTSYSSGADNIKEALVLPM